MKPATKKKKKVHFREEAGKQEKSSKFVSRWNFQCQ